MRVFQSVSVSYWLVGCCNNVVVQWYRVFFLHILASPVVLVRTSLSVGVGRLNRYPHADVGAVVTGRFESGHAFESARWVGE